MEPRLAAGVTRDFLEAGSEGGRLGALLFSPLFFLCCLLTRIPRQQERRTEYSRVMSRGRMFSAR